MNLSDIKERPHWSYSSLNQMLNICSLQWFFQRVAKVQPSHVPVNLVLGSAYHRTLEQVYLAKKNGSVFTGDEALEFFTSSWRLATENQPVRFSKLSAEETADQGRKLIACALENIDPDEKVLSISEAFIVPVSHRGEYLELPLVGEFDLVVEQEGHPVVKDWKTSATRWSAFQADKSLQATVYSYAYSQKTGINPRVMFDVAVKNKTPVFEQHVTLRTPDSWERMGCLVAKAEQVVKHRLYYPAETSFSCGDCPFRGACQAWHQEGGGQMTEDGDQRTEARAA